MSIPTDKPHIWDGRPSHLIRLHIYTMWGAIAVGAAGLFFALPGLLEPLGLSPAALEYVPYAKALALGIAIYAAGVIGWTWLNLKYTYFLVTPDTIFSRRNWFSGDYDTLWLNRVIDVKAERPLWYRMLGLGRVRVISLDRSDPEFLIDGISDALTLKHLLNDLANEQGQAAGTRAIDTGA